MQTLTAEQFKAKYGDAGLSSFTPTKTEPTNSYFSRVTNGVGGDLAKRIDTTAGILNRKDTGLITKGVQLFGQGAGLASNALETTIAETPGVKQAVQGIGEGIKWLATSDLSPIKHLGGVIGSNKTLQEIAHLYDTDPSFKDTIDAVGNTVRLGGDVSTIINSANFSANVTNKVINGVKETTSALSNTVSPITDTVKNTAKNTLNNAVAPENIMQRVARLNPLDEVKFKDLSGGKTVGQYLKETGNFKNPVGIVTKEAEKYVTSMNSVDEALGKLNGVYKNGAIEDALNGLLERANNTSAPNTPSPILSEIESLASKYNSEGLSMKEINTVKRLYEREVKLGYKASGLINPDRVVKATNVDTALRKWQLSTAKELGFKNIDTLNKQTQLSKFLVNKLGAKITGQSANNALGLTDWIVLANGNPQAVAGFLTKKFFGNKTVQARIAELLNKGEIKGQITPDIQPTIKNTLRGTFPEGTPLELPAGKSKTSQNFVPIQRGGASSIENSSPKTTNTTINPKTGDQYVRDLKTGKMKIIPKNAKKK